MLTLKVEGEVNRCLSPGRLKGQPNVYYDTALLEVVGNVVGGQLIQRTVNEGLGPQRIGAAQGAAPGCGGPGGREESGCAELHDEIGQAFDVYF